MAQNLLLGSVQDILKRPHWAGTFSVTGGSERGRVGTHDRGAGWRVEVPERITMVQSSRCNTMAVHGWVINSVLKRKLGHVSCKIIVKN